MPSRSLVISFHRSGLHWLRHAAEHYGGVRTPGKEKHLIQEGPILFDRTHDVLRPNKSCEFVALKNAAGEEIYERVGILLRDPYQTFVSHYLLRKKMRFARALADFETYANNIVGFDSLAGGTRSVFYFEDFASKEPGTMELLCFFGVTPKGDTDFPALIESSRAWYKQRQGLFDSGERPELKPRHHRAIGRMLARRLGPLREKYLSRYLAN